MIRIGIIGSESSHAAAFAKYFNCPDPKTGICRYQDIRVVAAAGSKESLDVLAREAGPLFFAEKPEDLLGKIDAVMVTSRRGSTHYQYALPFIRAGLPLFVDKPFTSDPQQAALLAGEISSRGNLVMGGSGCKYAESVQKLKLLVQKLRKEGSFIGGAINFDVMLDSPYDGIYFYASHLVEMCLEIFGEGIRSVSAVRTGGSLTAALRYEAGAVSLHFTAGAKQSSCVLFSREKNYVFGIDIAGIYDAEAARFAEMLLGKRPPLPLRQLTYPIEIIDAIIRAEQLRREIPLT